MSEIFKKTVKSPKKTLNDLMKDKLIITGKEAIQVLKDKEVRQKEFEASIEYEERNWKSRG